MLSILTLPSGNQNLDYKGLYFYPPLALMFTQLSAPVLSLPLWLDRVLINRKVWDMPELWKAFSSFNFSQYFSSVFSCSLLIYSISKTASLLTTQYISVTSSLPCKLKHIFFTSECTGQRECFINVHQFCSHKIVDVIKFSRKHKSEN